ncbi:DUF4365 domain-containing protein [Guptibacillus hwajinpoensis]|uniref:DUF4365 domain-containing protein n=1 Tax=Guptibacillus hwajinpoensis TaxID=208199 RepID=UPI001CFD9F68|nr:DUF4365 domain-containing protein [Pseudalkalibacillus hwajinpoensis]WLR60161.1 DUF4365 domain-containing protein [Pseudalkalibacillus hwajinpoensis]
MKEKTVKKSKKVNEQIDNKIIEHMACLEINHLILQPPFHLIGNIQYNDKGLCFDGDIEVYNDINLQKETYINKVSVQVKGTTMNKKVSKKNKIKHKVDKRDIEVYHKTGQGVLYFVVTINPNTLKKQAFYRILAPLDLKSLLNNFKAKGTKTTLLSFKKLEENRLENVCNTLVNLAEKQPNHFLDSFEQDSFNQFKLQFTDIQENTFNEFEEPAYMYGVCPQGIEYPLDLVKITQKQGVIEEVISLDKEELLIRTKVTEREKTIALSIENTLTFEITKRNMNSTVTLGRLKNLDSYIKCLKILQYHTIHNTLPLSRINVKAEWGDKTAFNNIDEDIRNYEELKGVCKQIGISETYEFHEKEDLPRLFNGIIDTFKNKNTDSFNIPGSQSLPTNTFINFDLSEYISVKLYYSGEHFLNVFSEHFLNTVGGFQPKNDKTDHPHQKRISEDDWKTNFYQVSAFSLQEVSKLSKFANYDFDIVKKSFSDEYHDIRSDITIISSLKYLRQYMETDERKYLELGNELNERYLKEFPKDEAARINIFLIKLVQDIPLSEKEQSEVLDIQEMADHNYNTLAFACEVLFKNKVKAQRIFNKMSNEEKQTLEDYPIYIYFQTL